MPWQYVSNYINPPDLVKYMSNQEIFMSDFFARDPRIQDDIIRDLEKKIHYLMACIDNQGMLMDNTVFNVPCLPGEVMADAMEVAKQL
jgi:hypothetical protein